MPILSLCEMLVDHLDKHGCARKIIQSHSELKVYRVDFSHLKLRLSDLTPLIEIPEAILESHSADDVVHLIRDTIIGSQLNTKIPILVFEGPHESVKKLLDSSASYKGSIASLSKAETESILASDHPSDLLLAVIRPQLSLLTLSPYEISAPVLGSQFFGRESEIRTIINHPSTNYLIIGSRRVGKTSLIKEIQRRSKLDEDLRASEPNTTTEERFYYFDCQMYNSGEEFMTDVMLNLSPREYNRLDRIELIKYFPGFLRNFSRQVGGRINLFMDEVDHLLKIERQWQYPLIRALMAASNNEYCRLVWGGFRDAADELQTFESPAYAKLTPINLGPFKIHELRQLVEMPMDNLGIKIRDRENIVKRIERDTGGHPNFIQYICQSVLKQLDENGSREFTQANLLRLDDDESFRERVIGMFTTNTSDFEKAVAYAVADRESFTIRDLNETLTRLAIPCEISQMEEALNFLEYLGAINQRGLEYKFTVPILPHLLRTRYDDRFIKNKVLESKSRSSAR